jgi:transcriptional regulator with XRE-family HTH domain
MTMAQPRGDVTALPRITPDRDASPDASSVFAVAVREEMARRRLSRQQLADTAKVSISTLEKALSGKRPFTLATMVRVEEALGVQLRKTSAKNGAASLKIVAGAAASQCAVDELGSYTRPAVQFLEGSYVTIRQSLGDLAAVYAYRTDISWDAGQSCLTFQESERIDAAFSHFGTVAIPNQTGHIYLSTNRHGQQRLAILSRPASSGEMHGLLLTLQAGRGAHLMPIATPIVLAPVEKGTKPAFGRIAAGHDAFSKYRALLKKTLADHFAMMLGD